MSITPVGPHAHLYDRFGITVEQLDEVPAFDEASSQYMTVDLWSWCPVCGRRVSEIWSYLLEVVDDRAALRAGQFYIGDGRICVALRLRRCMHIVTAIIITTQPDGVVETPLTNTPVYAALPIALGDETRPYSRPSFDLPPEPDVQPGDVVDTPSGPMTVTDVRTRSGLTRPARPNPSAYSDGGGGRGRRCALCGSSVTHYGWEKRRLRRGSWRRRWVHIDCP